MKPYLLTLVIPMLVAVSPLQAQNIRPANLTPPSSDPKPSDPAQLAPPRTLPDLSPGLNDPRTTDAAQTTPVEPALKSFIPHQAMVRFESNRYQVWAGTELLKDCGLDRMSAEQIAATIRDNGFSHRGEIPGANPPFEYWLVKTGVSDGKSKLEAATSESRMTRAIMLPIDIRAIEVEHLAGAWCVRDAGRILYNFGPRRESAERAADILKKYGFNAMGIVGQPQPVMTYPIKAASAVIQSPLPMTGKRSPIDEGTARFLSDGLFIPEVGYLGHRKPIDARKIQLTRGRDWALVAGSETLLTFGTDETTARQVLKAFEDWRISEYVEVGEPAFRFYISNGQIPHGTPFNARTLYFRAADAKLVKGPDGHFGLQAGATALLDVGADEKDAKLMLAAVKHFDVDALVKFGSPQHGEYAFLVRSR